MRDQEQKAIEEALDQERRISRRQRLLKQLWRLERAACTDVARIQGRSGRPADPQPDPQLKA